MQHISTSSEIEITRDRLASPAGSGDEASNGLAARNKAITDKKKVTSIKGKLEIVEMSNLFIRDDVQATFV